MFQSKDDRDLISQLLRLGVVTLPGFLLIYQELGPKTLELDGVLFLILGIVVSGLLFLAYQFGVFFVVMVLNALVPKDKFQNNEVNVFSFKADSKDKKSKELSQSLFGFYVPGALLTFFAVVLINGNAPANSFIDNVTYCAFANAGLGFILATRTINFKEPFKSRFDKSYTWAFIIFAILFSAYLIWREVSI